MASNKQTITITEHELIEAMAEITSNDETLENAPASVCLALLIRDANICACLVEKLFGKENE